MNALRWINHFRQNRQNRPEPDWSAPIKMDPRIIAKVLPSLEQFQLGDGGGPASLIARDAGKFTGKSNEIRTLVDLWFAEEREHSRLLGCAVKRFNGRRIESHWSFSAFCACRRVLGVRFELQVLLLTEIVSTAYYRVLRRHVDDEAVKAMCSLILRDEAGHVAFHRARLAGSGSPTLRQFPWQIQFWFCGIGAATMLWINHRGCLEAIGGTQAEYYQEVRLEISRFLRRLSHDLSVQKMSEEPVVVAAVAALQ